MVSMFSISLELLLNKQFRDFFFFFRLKDREDEDEKRKEIQSWGKMKDEGIRADYYSFYVFLLFYSNWNISWIIKMGIFGNFYLLITFVPQRQLFYYFLFKAVEECNSNSWYLLCFYFKIKCLKYNCPLSF